MKEQKYLLEQSISKIVETIKENCSPFLKEFKDKPLYRGTDSRIRTIELKVPRKNRKPRDMPISVSTDLDNFFEKKFGVKLRSEAVFITPNATTSLMYGGKYYFFPVGKYDYYWIPSIADIYVYLENVRTRHPWYYCLKYKKYIYEYIENETGQKYEVGIENTPEYKILVSKTLDYLKKDFLEKLKENVIDMTVKNKNGVQNKGNEMMFIVKSYYIVNQQNYPSLYSNLNSN